MHTAVHTAKYTVGYRWSKRPNKKIKFEPDLHWMRLNAKPAKEFVAVLTFRLFYTHVMQPCLDIVVLQMRSQPKKNLGKLCFKSLPKIWASFEKVFTASLFDAQH